MKSIADCYPELVERLAGVSQTPNLDAQLLLAHVVGVNRSWVLAHPEALLSAQETAAIAEKIARLEAGEPLPYVIGEWEFYGLKFQISPAVLIPRPETELLVEKALLWLRAHPGEHLAADVGTGSGCIAVALAKNHPSLRVIASDISLPALEIARVNIKLHHLEARIECVQADLFPPTAVRFSLICANLPYIPANNLRRLKVHRWEPHVALRGGQDGLELIRKLVAQLPQSQAGYSLLLLEIEARQGEAVREIASAAYPRAKIELIPDLAGNDRLVAAEISTGHPPL